MPKHKQFVCQHLEYLSRQALELHQDIIRQYVRDRHGVYVLYGAGKICYIGPVSNLRSQLTHHLKDKHKQSWDSFSVYLTIDDDYMGELESLILRIIKPHGNKPKWKFAKSDDLRQRFVRDLQNRQRQELKRMIRLGTQLIRAE